MIEEAKFLPEEKSKPVVNKELMDKLGAYCYGEFSYNEKFRRDREIEWIEDLRQVKAIYDTEDEARIPLDGSKVYPKYTRSKEVPCIAKLNSMLFPDNDKNWEIEPTPNPELDDAVLQEIIATTVQAAMQKQIQPTPEDVEKAITRYAEERCAAMAQEMDDQLVELGYKEISKRVIRSGIRYGTGVLKGPLAEPYKQIKIVRNSAGEYEQQPEIKFRPSVSFLPIWYWYPDMTVTEISECSHFYELHMMSKHQLRKLAKQKNFFADMIAEILKEQPDGNYVLKPWQVDLQNIGDIVSDKNVTGKYQVLERWGYIDGHFLLAAGNEIPEDQLDVEYYANIFICGQKTIKAIISPVPETIDLYHAFYFDKDESSIFGQGLPRSIRDTQLTICAAARMMLDNGATVAGPQMEINVDYLVKGQDPTKFHSRKIWFREGRGQEGQYPMIRPIEFNSHIPEFIQIIQEFKRFGDEESSLPSTIFGPQETTGNETARGMSIRSSNIMVTLADIVKSFDECNERFLRSLYAWNNEFSEKEEIKGDFKVKASGSSSLMAKESRTQSLDYFATTLNELDEPYLNRREFLLERVLVHDLPENIILTEQEASEKITAQRDQEIDMLNKQKLALEAELDKAKADLTIAKTEKLRGDTEVDRAHKMSDMKVKETDAVSRRIDAHSGALTAIKTATEKKEEKKSPIKK